MHSLTITGWTWTKCRQPATGHGTGSIKGSLLWRNGYRWFKVFWGTFWNGQPLEDQEKRATSDIESNLFYSGGLGQYKVGIDGVWGSVVVLSSPPHKVFSTDIDTAITGRIRRDSPRSGLHGGIQPIPAAWNNGLAWIRFILPVFSQLPTAEARWLVTGGSK
jgi:hypothetical protein